MDGSEKRPVEGYVRFDRSDVSTSILRTARVLDSVIVVKR